MSRSIMKMKNIAKWLLQICIAVIILGCISFGLYLTCNEVHKHAIQRHIILRNTSDNFNFWTGRSKPPIHLDFYFFNWTNPNELIKSKKKPNFVQVGPYSFREVRQKVNVTFNSNNGTVSYFQRQLWYFDEKRSNGTLEDKVSLFDPAIVLTVDGVRTPSYFDISTSTFKLDQLSHINVIERVGDLLLDGYKKRNQHVRRLADFIYLSMRNGTVGIDNFNVATGEKDINQLGLLKKWNYKNTSSYFEKLCNQIEGSIGDLWPPNQTEEEIKLFMPELCRAMIYEFEKKSDYMGIKGNKYTLGNRTLNNDRNLCYLLKLPKDITKNSFYDFCEPKNMVEECYCGSSCNPIGFINLASCHSRRSVLISLPHFYKTEPKLRDQVEGLNPNEDEHNSYVILEPNTGIPLEMVTRLQISMSVRSKPTMTFFRPNNIITTTHFPLFWFSMKMKVSEEFASELKTLISFNFLVFETVAVITFIALLMFFFFLWYRQNKNSTSIMNYRVIEEYEADLLRNN